MSVLATLHTHFYRRFVDREMQCVSVPYIFTVVILRMQSKLDDCEHHFRKL